jgi:hypothetical protein
MNLILSGLTDRQIYSYIYDARDRPIYLKTQYAQYGDRNVDLNFGGITIDRPVKTLILISTFADRPTYLNFGYVIDNRDRQISSFVCLPLWIDSNVLAKIGIIGYSDRVLYMVRRSKIIPETITKSFGVATSESPASVTAGTAAPETSSKGTAGAVSQEVTTEGNVS